MTAPTTKAPRASNGEDISKDTGSEADMGLIADDRRHPPGPGEEEDRLAHLVIGAAIEVHRGLGPGHKESVYEEALAIELGLRDVAFARQHAASIA